MENPLFQKIDTAPFKTIQPAHFLPALWNILVNN